MTTGRFQRRKQGDRRAALPILPLAMSLLVAAIVSACSGSQAAPGAGMPPPEVSVAQVLSRNVKQWDDFTGRVAAVEPVELRPRVSGYVERVAYREGDDVRKGQLHSSPAPAAASVSKPSANSPPPACIPSSPGATAPRPSTPR